jgi:hypothetical protein
VTDHADSHDDGLVGLLEVGHELFDDWLWACAVEEPHGLRLLHSRPLPATARATMERWAGDLLRDRAVASLPPFQEALRSYELVLRTFVVRDRGQRTIALMGVGPSNSVSAAADRIIDAVARNLDAFGVREEARRV